MFELGNRSLRGALNAAQVHGAAGGVRQLSDCFVSVFIVRGSETLHYCSRFLSCSHIFSCSNVVEVVSGQNWTKVEDSRMGQNRY